MIRVGTMTMLGRLRFVLVSARWRGRTRWLYVWSLSRDGVAEATLWRYGGVTRERRKCWTPRLRQRRFEERVARFYAGDNA